MQMIYGGSDDLIELTGDIDEEFGAFSGRESETGYIALSCGVLLQYNLDDENDGVWMFREVGAPSGKVTIVQARGEDAGNDEDGCPGYSQKAVVDDTVTWVMHGKEFAK